MYDIMIVGAGPSGSFVAGRCAEAGLKTLVLEEHPEIGFPVHCTGIVSDKFLQEFNVPDYLIQKKLTLFKIFDPSGKALVCPANIKANVIFRKKFDDYLAERAIQKGAEYFLSTKVTDVIQDENRAYVNIVQDGRKTQLSGKLCIIATGSMSDLPFASGIDRPHSFLYSIQVDAEIENLEGVELYLGNKYAPGSFAYAVSINGRNSKIGLIVKDDIKKSFDNLISSPFLADRAKSIHDNRVYRRFPLGFPKNSLKGRIIAVGDAAGQVKTTTGGGIYYGLICARILSHIILGSRRENDFNKAKLAEYDRLWKKEIIKELRIGMLFRAFLESISDQDIQAILEILGRKEIIRLIEDRSDFDFHQRLVLSLLKVPELRTIVFRFITRKMRIFNNSSHMGALL